jgi:ketosteroid isomerase-like protein
MPLLLSQILHALLVLAPPQAAAEPAAALLQRQTQELADAITYGKAAVWEKYLDPDVRYVDESGAVLKKKELVDGVKPLPAGVSGSIRILEYDAVVHGDTAVATYVSDENEDYHGAKLHCQYRTTDTWAKGPNGWRLVAGQVLAMRTDPPPVELPEALRKEYAGTYVLAPDLAYDIKVAGGELEGQQTGRKPETLKAEAPDVLFVPGRPRYRYVILRNSRGAITGLAQRREAWDLVWKRNP